MKIFKELKKLGYKHYTEHTIEELDNLPLNSEERIMEQALVFRWFREKHKQDSLVIPSGDSTGKTNGYYYEIVFDFSKENIESESFKTYEEAESACLDKLIEICKTKINE
jgi:hypothetical protein